MAKHESGTKTRLFTANFTLLLLGQVSSLFGNVTLRFALSMYVLDLTGSAGVFSLITAASMLPTVLLSPLGGVLADRADRRRIMVTLDTLSALAVVAAALCLPLSELGATAALLVALSVLAAFESPTVQACVPQMLTGDNVLRGNALVSQVQALASLLGPVLGAAAYTYLGMQAVMAGAALCFFVTALFETGIKLPPAAAQARSGAFQTVKSDLAESWRFIRREQPEVLSTLLFAALASALLAGVMVVGYPYLVRTVLGLPSGYYGAAESAAGVAAVLGSALAGMSASRSGSIARISVLCAGLALLPSAAAFVPGVGRVPAFVILVVSFSIAQAACSAFSVCAITRIQSLTPEHLTGKVMSFVYTLSMCAQPLGQIIYGALFDALSPAWVLVPSAVLVLICSFIYGRNRTNGLN